MEGEEMHEANTGSFATIADLLGHLTTSERLQLDGEYSVYVRCDSETGYGPFSDTTGLHGRTAAKTRRYTVNENAQVDKDGAPLPQPIEARLQRCEGTGTYVVTFYQTQDETGLGTGVAVSNVPVLGKNTEHIHTDDLTRTIRDALQQGYRTAREQSTTGNPYLNIEV